MKQRNQFKIFLVNDDAFGLNLYQQHLRNLDYDDVEIFTNGTACINHLAQQPDVIFLNYGTDILGDVEVLQRIKRFNPDIYVIFISGHEDVETAVHSLKYGAFDYIVKGNYEERRIGQILKNIKAANTLLQSCPKNLV